MSRFNVKGNVMILITTLIWGTAFVAQVVGMENVGPFTFISVRFLIGGLVTCAAAVFFARLSRAKTGQSKASADFKSLFNPKTLAAGAICGAVLFAASSLQQVGMQYTTAGKAGFLTSLYVLFVPLLGLFFRRKPRVFVWLGMILALAGTYFLSITEGFTLNPGDAYVLASALFFAFHIMVIDRYVKNHDAIALSGVQFLGVAVIATIFMFALEEPNLQGISAASFPILYAGLLSSGVAYTLQTKAQKITAPAVAAILFSMESVFAALSGYIIIGEILTRRELLGCALVFCAVIVAQIAPKRKDKIGG